MACADVATAKAKATAINLFILVSPLRTFNLEECISLVFRWIAVVIAIVRGAVEKQWFFGRYISTRC